MADFRMGRFHTLRSIYFNYIKSRLQLSGMFRQVDRCRHPDSILFAPVYILSCFGKMRIFPQLYLHKYKIFPGSGNQINFSEPTVIMSSLNFIIFPAKIIGRKSLSPGTEKITSPHRISSESSSGVPDLLHALSEQHNVPWYRILCGSQTDTGDIPPPV